MTLIKFKKDTLNIYTYMYVLIHNLIFISNLNFKLLIINLMSINVIIIINIKFIKFNI